MVSVRFLLSRRKFGVGETMGREWSSRGSGHEEGGSNRNPRGLEKGSGMNPEGVF